MALSFGQVLHSSAFTIKEYFEAGQSEHFPFVFWDYPGIHPDIESAPYNLAALPATTVFYILG